MKNKENESVGHLFYLQKCMLLKMNYAFCVVGASQKDGAEKVETTRPWQCPPGSVLGCQVLCLARFLF